LSPADGPDGWESSLMLDFASGTTAIGPRWGHRDRGTSGRWPLGHP
jgi:hypothetical protein